MSSVASRWIFRKVLLRVSGFPINRRYDLNRHLLLTTWPSLFAFCFLSLAIFVMPLDPINAVNMKKGHHKFDPQTVSSIVELHTLPGPPSEATVNKRFAESKEFLDEKHARSLKTVSCSPTPNSRRPLPSVISRPPRSPKWSKNLPRKRRSCSTRTNPSRTWLWPSLRRRSSWRISRRTGRPTRPTTVLRSLS